MTTEHDPNLARLQDVLPEGFKSEISTNGYVRELLVTSSSTGRSASVWSSFYGNQSIFRYMDGDTLKRLGPTSELEAAAERLCAFLNRAEILEGEKR